MSVSASGKFCYPTGRDGAEALGYDPDIIQKAHPRLLDAFCGVGNPFTLGDILPGATVLDIGCGAGFDMFVASLLAGKRGKVCGTDLTRCMADLARKNLALAGAVNFEVRDVDSDLIPYGDDSFDIVISNGVINLSPSKEVCFSEIVRVLKPGGRLQFADVVLEHALPRHLEGNLDAWAH